MNLRDVLGAGSFEWASTLIGLDLCIYTLFIIETGHHMIRNKSICSLDVGRYVGKRLTWEVWKQYGGSM